MSSFSHDLARGHFFAPLFLAMAGTALWVAVAVLPATLWASPTEVVHARFRKGAGGWEVSVTLRHGDTGWQHYANLWVVETMDGKELGRRVLFHPHEDEQPFTRSETIAIPAAVTQVRVRAGDNVQGLNSNVVAVNLAQPKGTRFEVR